MIVLKFIGIALLVILAIILIVLLYVIFAPIRYDILGKWNGERYVRFRISDLLHIVSARIVYDMTEGLNICIKLLGLKKISIAGGSDTDDKGPSNDASPSDDKGPLDEDAGSSDDDGGKEPVDTSPLDGDMPTCDLESAGSSDEASAKKASSPDEAEPSPDSKKSFASYLTRENLNAVRFIIGALLSAIKRILPHIRRISGSFSLGSPDTTGQIFGAISCLPVMYQKGNYLHADFASDKVYFDGEIEARGRVRLSWFIGAAIRVFLNKESRKLIFDILGG